LQQSHVYLPAGNFPNRSVSISISRRNNAIIFSANVSMSISWLGTSTSPVFSLDGKLFVNVIGLVSLIQSFVDAGDFSHPLAAKAMVEIEYRIGLPVEIIGDVGYLLVELFPGVA
jgi:hypothetical protein